MVILRERLLRSDFLGGAVGLIEPLLFRAASVSSVSPW
jgi:hypothetical protein